MAIFLTRQQVYRMLQRELPPYVYPDGAPSAFFSTAENDAVAETVSASYANQEKVYDNYFPGLADERIMDWEVTVFGYNLDAALSLSEKRARVLAKIRTRKGITLPDMISVVKAIIGSDKLVDIQEWGCYTGGWIISESELSIETILNGARLTDVTGAFICEATPAQYGKTQAEWEIMQEEAYTYQVNIYGYTMTAAEAIEVEAALLLAEPARSNHVIVDGLNPDDMLEGTL